MPIDWCPPMASTPTANCFVVFFFAVSVRSSISSNFSSFHQCYWSRFTPMMGTYKKFWKLLCEKVGVHSHTPPFCSKNDSEHLENVGKTSLLKCVFRAFDADFFNNTKMDEVLKGAEEFNAPTIRANRKLVASENGGLHIPSPLVFNPEWPNANFRHKSKRFCYPPVSGVKRPKSEEDIAFMSVLELGELIKTEQISSQELVRIFLQRLKRCFK